MDDPPPCPTAPPPPTLVTWAASTHRARREDTQDAAALRPGGNGAMPGVFVADGLGSFARSGEAARFVANEAAALLGHLDHVPSAQAVGCLPALFAETRRRLTEFAAPLQAEMRADGLPTDRTFATTLLAAVETEAALGIAYVGNGAIFHLPGDWAAWGANLPLPWAWANLLRPHSVLRNGVEALTRYLRPACAASEDDEGEPTVLWIRKDRRSGDLVLLCTDGVFSSDQARCGSLADGSRWHEVPRPLLALHDALRVVWTGGGDAPLTTDRVQAALQACLDGLRERGDLDDDATVGLLATGAAVAFAAERAA